MDVFDTIKDTKNDDEAMLVLLECTRVAMKQYFPEISKNIEDLENNIDLPTVHEILDLAGNIKIGEDSEEDVKTQAQKGDPGPSWEDFDLAKIESEVFLLGIWKDYQELEANISMPELVATLASIRDLDYQEKKFLAAIQGVDLEGETSKDKGQKEWEDMKARVFSGGKATDSNDVLALQGVNAQKAGFGIGMGLDYGDERDPSLMK